MDARYSPRAPLPLRWCYHRPGLSRGRSQSELPDLHRSYRLMRQTKILLPTSVSLFRQVFAGYCKPLLEDGHSRRYLCDPCMGAWVRTPPRLNGAFVRFFPLSIGLSLGARRSAPGKIIPQRSFLWEVFSGLQPFVYLQAPILARPTDCSDRQDSEFLRPPGRIHRAEFASLPITNSGITTCPNRTIDTTGLVMASAITHLLDRSLVGCSCTLHLATLAYLLSVVLSVLPVVSQWCMLPGG
jgi:hypothetical protein